MKWQTVLTACTALLLTACGTITEDKFSGDCWFYRVDGVVRDQRGEPVNGAEVLLRKSNGTTWRVISGSAPAGETRPAGTFLFLADGVGQYTLRVNPPSGYTVPSTQTNPLTFTLTQQQCNNADLTFSLHRTEQ